jgi:transposase-like protein
MDKIIFSSFPKNSIEFDERFSNEESCEAFLFEKRWGDGFACSHCQHTEYWKDGRGNYTCKKCQHQHSLKAGTIMHSSKKPLKVWFKAIWLFTVSKRGISAKELQTQLGVSYPTAWLWLQKLRRSSLNEQRKKLSGKVEVDEFYLGGKHKGKQGRGSENKHKVVIAVEKLEYKGKQYVGRIRLKVVTSCNTENLTQFVLDNIQGEAEIDTDKWTGYNKLTENNYKHTATKISDYDIEFKGLHNIVSLIKRWILGTFQGRTSKKHIQWYLQEYVFRFNRRSFNIGKMFDRALDFAIIHKPMRYSEIVDELEVSL